MRLYSATVFTWNANATMAITNTNGEATPAAPKMAPNTVSTVAAHLVEGGLLERRRDERDRRGVRFFLTDAANRQLAGWRDQRLALLATALATLSPGDRDQIEAALPALGRLVEAVQRTVGPRAVAPGRRPGARDEGVMQR